MGADLSANIRGSSRSHNYAKCSAVNRAKAMSNNTINRGPVPTHVSYLLRLADGALILAQRLSEWCGHGPVLEEDIAFANIGLDLLGQARLLYTHAGALEGRGRTEDTFAYWRDEAEFFNPTLVELPNGDFAQSVLRAYLFVLYQQNLWARLVSSTDAELAAIAEKSAKETRYHVRHLGNWILRLGDGTAESQARMQKALDYLMPYTAELFEPDVIDEDAASIRLGPPLGEVAADWRHQLTAILNEATLVMSIASPFLSSGKRGQHSEVMGYLLSEMQSLARAHPGATW